MNRPLSLLNVPFTRRLALSVLALAGAQLAHGQGVPASLAGLPAMDQVRALMMEKAQRTPAQRKMSSDLILAQHALRQQRMQGIDEVYTSALDSARPDTAGRVTVAIRADSTGRVGALIERLGGTVEFASERDHSLRATLPLLALDGVAMLPAVRQISSFERGTTNAGALTSQGYISHKANQAVGGGFDGTNVRVGVLSDSATAARVAALIASGDLPADTVVVPGQASTGTDEGTAMMEIVHDIAPGAKLFFATANADQAQFAANIRTLRNDYHCDIIVDDYTYFAEGAFQDGIVAAAVNDVTANGALYFSSAANSGNLTSGTSGTWEGDFADGGAVDGPVGTSEGGTGQFHAFAAGQNYDVLTAASTTVTLHWSDPLLGSANDYDLFILNAAGTSVLCSAFSVQSGTQNPYEQCSRAAGYPAGSRVVVVKFSGDARALRVDAHRGRLSLNTVGSTYGHNAGEATVSTAAVYWNSAKTGTKPFVGGAANPTEVFSSDGPRKIFFKPDGTPITPGNLLFATNGGTTLQKPDIAAADGVSTKTPGFNPFFGTSAAAPHAAGVAALIKSARPDYTNAKILAAMKATALDIRAVGIDRDAGSGIVMAWEAIQYALTH